MNIYKKLFYLLIVCLFTPAHGRHGRDDAQHSILPIRVKSSTKITLGVTFYIGDGRFVTDFHLLMPHIQDPNISVYVLYEDEKIEVTEWLHFDAIKDLAVLRMDHDLTRNLKPLEVRGTGRPNKVIVWDSEWSSQETIEIPLDRQITTTENTIEMYHSRFNVGMSGVPLLSEDHKVLGVLREVVLLEHPSMEKVTFTSSRSLLDLLSEEKVHCLLKECIDEEMEILRLEGESGNARALYLLGRYHMEGKYFTQNQEEGFKLSLEAGRQGYHNVYMDLGRMYYFGISKVIKPNLSESFFWFKRAADFGFLEAKYRIGNMYYLGEGTEQNLSKAFSYIEEAANEGHLEARYSLGMLYGNGQGVAYSGEKALKFLKMAAKEGHQTAIFTLGQIYALGIVTMQDLNKSIEYLETSRDQGYPGAYKELAESQGELAREYWSGINREQSYWNSSVLWFQYYMNQFYGKFVK